MAREHRPVIVEREAAVLRKLGRDGREHLLHAGAPDHGGQDPPVKVDRAAQRGVVLGSPGVRHPLRQGDERHLVRDGEQRQIPRVGLVDQRGGRGVEPDPQREAHGAAATLVKTRDELALQLLAVAHAEPGRQQDLTAFQPGRRVGDLADVDPADGSTAAQTPVARDEREAERGIAEELLQPQRHRTTRDLRGEP
jgi:hypothetical protein